MLSLKMMIILMGSYAWNLIKVVVKLKIAGPIVPHNKKEVKKCAAAINFLSSCWFLNAAETTMKKRGPPGAPYGIISLFMYNWQIFYLLILIRGKMQQLPYKYHCVNIIKISLENANSQSLKLMNESKE